MIAGSTARNWGHKVISGSSIMQAVSTPDPPTLCVWPTSWSWG